MTRMRCIAEVLSIVRLLKWSMRAQMAANGFYHSKNSWGVGERVEWPLPEERLASCSLLLGRVLGRLLVEGSLAACGAEVVGLPLILGLSGCSLLIHSHAANRILHFNHLPSVHY